MSYLYDRVGFLLRRCHQISVSIFLQECGHLDLTPTQFGILYAIQQNAGADQLAIAKMLGLDRSTTSTVVDRLVARGLVRREIHPQDRRRRSHTLTETGECTLGQAFDRAAQAQARLLQPLTNADRSELLRLLREVMEAHGADARVPFDPACGMADPEGATP